VPAWDRAWRAATNRIAREADQRIAASLVAYAQGRLSADELVAIISTLVARAQRRTVTANDVLLARELTAQLLMEVAPTGLVWMEPAADQTARLATAVNDVIGADIAYVEAESDPVKRAVLKAHSMRERLVRLSDGQVANASQWSRQEAAKLHRDTVGLVGYTRVLSPGACDLCRKIGGSPPDRFVHPLDHRFAAHPTGSCKCTMHFVNNLRPGDKWLGPWDEKPKAA
jgi:histone H3/H4